MSSAACILRCILGRPSCLSWRRFMSTRMETEIIPPQIPKAETEIIRKTPPLLMTSPRSKPKFRFFYDVTVGKITHKVCLPSIRGHHFIGSSQGFLLSTDKYANIHATNPFTGAHLSLPSTSSLPNIAGIVMKNEKTITHYIYSGPQGYNTLQHIKYMQYDYIHKAILSPLLDVVVLIEHGLDRRLAFAKLNKNNDDSFSWTALESSPLAGFHDIILHKGRLYAVGSDGFGALAVLDLENPSDLPLVSPLGPFAANCRMWTCYLVESLDGEDLFLVERQHKDYLTTNFRVFKLDKNNNFKWNQVEHVGDAAIFVGANQSVAVPKLPGLEPNSVHFTDYVYDPEEDADTGVFSLRDGRIKHFPLEKGRRGFNYQRPAIWYVPSAAAAAAAAAGPSKVTLLSSYIFYRYYFHHGSNKF